MYFTIILFLSLAIIFTVLAVKKGFGSNIKSFKRLVRLSSISVGLSTLSVIVNSVSFAANEVSKAGGITDNAIAFISAALATGLASLGAGYAVAVSASAAIGAISEKESLTGKALIFVAMGEGIALYGVLIAVLILNKI